MLPLPTLEVTILDRLEVEDAPCSIQGCGVSLAVPRNSLRGGIGPVTVEDTAEVVSSRDGSVLIAMQVVHCLPSPCSFEAPLTLDFVVRDDRVRWWDRAAVREEVLREYQVRVRVGLIQATSALREYLVCDSHFATSFVCRFWPTDTLKTKRR